MPIRAECQQCGREFLLFQLSKTDAELSDRCPHCARRLGSRRFGALAARAEGALATFVTTLEEMGQGSPRFVIRHETVFEPIADALATHRSDGRIEWASDARGVAVRAPRPAPSEPRLEHAASVLTTQARIAQRTLSEPAVAFAASVLLIPFVIVLAALLIGESDPRSPLYTVAAVMFAVSVVGFVGSAWRAWRHRPRVQRHTAYRVTARRQPISRPR